MLSGAIEIEVARIELEQHLWSRKELDHQYSMSVDVAIKVFFSNPRVSVSKGEKEGGKYYYDTKETKEICNQMSTIKLANRIERFRKGDLGKWKVVYYSVSNIKKLKALTLLNFVEVYCKGKL